jgi:hypothetical protein
MDDDHALVNSSDQDPSPCFYPTAQWQSRMVVVGGAGGSRSLCRTFLHTTQPIISSLQAALGATIFRRLNLDSAGSPILV